MQAEGWGDIFRDRQTGEGLMAGYLNVDLILVALIGAEENPVEHLLSAAERGEQQLMISG
jgi:hypothetical protein